MRNPMGNRSYSPEWSYSYEVKPKSDLIKATPKGMPELKCWLYLSEVEAFGENERGRTMLITKNGRVYYSKTSVKKIEELLDLKEK